MVRNHKKTLMHLILGLLCLSQIYGCTKVLQQRGDAIRMATKEADEHDFVGYEGALGKAITFLYEPPDDSAHALVLYLGNAKINDNPEYPLGEQVIPAQFPETSICSGTNNLLRAQQDVSVLGVSPGFPDCKLQAGRFIFDCTYWGYTLVSVSKSEISASGAVTNLINDPLSQNVSLPDMPDDYRSQKGLMPAVCRAISFRLSDWGKMKDYILMEYGDLKGGCPALETAHPRFPAYMRPLFGPASEAAMPQEEQDALKLVPGEWDSLVAATGNWAIPRALVDAQSPWAQDAKFGTINKEFVNFYARTGLVYPTTTFQEMDISATNNYSINIYSMNLPNLKLFHPNSGQFDSQNIWDPRWNDLILDREEPAHPRHWIDNLTPGMLTLCADIFERTKFINPDVRREEFTPPDPTEKYKSALTGPAEKDANSEEEE